MEKEKIVNDLKESRVALLNILLNSNANKEFLIRIGQSISNALVFIERDQFGEGVK